MCESLGHPMPTYDQIRAAGREMHKKVIEASPRSSFNPIRMAKRMTLPMSGKTLIFADEVVQNAFFDYWFTEYRVDGKTLAESVDPIAAGLTPLETDVLEGYRQAQTSLFEVDPAVLDEHRLRLLDLLDANRRVVLLTDIGFHESFRQIRARLAIFCRPVFVHGLAMTSGFSFIFEHARIPGLLDAYRKRTKKLSSTDLAEARFIFFYQKHLAIGLEQGYRDET